MDRKNFLSLFVGSSYQLGNLISVLPIKWAFCPLDFCIAFGFAATCQVGILRLVVVILTTTTLVAKTSFH